MSKWANDDVMDAALDWVATCTLLTVCSAQPTTYAEASSTYKLADVVLTAGDGNGDFTIGDGDSPGRKVTISQQTDIDIDDDGTATHVALCEGGDTLVYVTTCTSQALTSGGTVTVPAWDIEISDPV